MSTFDPFSPDPRKSSGSTGPRRPMDRAPLPSESRHGDELSEPDDFFDDEDESEEEALELTADMLAAKPRRGFDFERDMRSLPPLSTVLVIVLTVVFGWELASGALKNEAAIMRAGALERAAVLRGEWWRIPTSMHLHGDGGHLIGNCVGLFILGMAVEHAFGLWPAAILYFLSGAAGAVLSIMFEGGPTVGASGAIFGWLGAALAFYFRYRQRLISRDVRVGVVLLVWAGWSFFSGLLNPQISNFSHLGGLLAGFATAMLLPTRITALKASAVPEG